MVYLFVILALLCLAVKGFCGKKTSIYAEKISYAFLLNLVRMLLCIVVGLIVLLIESGGRITGIDWRLALISLTGGAGTAMLVVCWVLAIRENTLVKVDVACTVASLLPAILSLIFFKESLSGWKMLGFALILSAVIIVSIGKGGQKKTGLFGAIMLVLTALGDGIASFSQQLYKQFYTEGGMYTGETLYSEATFNFWMYIMAAAVIMVVYVVYVLTAGRKETTPEGEPLTTVRRIKDISKALPYVAIMAACLFGANYFQTISTSVYGMKAQVLYPLIKAGCLISSNLQGALLFNEKLTVQNIVGSFVALGGMVLINVLG